MKKIQRSMMTVAGMMVLALGAASGQQTTVRSSSSSNTFTTTATGGAGGMQSTAKDDLFDGTEVFAKGASDVTEITMDPDSLGIVGGKDKQKAHNMILNVVRTYSYDKPGMYRIEDVDAFRNKLNSGDWHCSVHTRSLKTGDSTDVCTKRRADEFVETAIITVEPKELTFIHSIRRKGAGESEATGLSEFPFLYGLPGHGSLAMLDPEAFADMQMAKARIMGMNLTALQAQIGPAMSQLKKLDSRKMQKSLDDASRKLDSLDPLIPGEQPTIAPQQPE